MTNLGITINDFPWIVDLFIIIIVILLAFNCLEFLLIIRKQKPFKITIQNAIGEPVEISGTGPLTIVGDLIASSGKTAVSWNELDRDKKANIGFP